MSEVNSGIQPFFGGPTEALPTVPDVPPSLAPSGTFADLLARILSRGLRVIFFEASNPEPDRHRAEIFRYPRVIGEVSVVASGQDAESLLRDLSSVTDATLNEVGTVPPDAA